jgi:predicted nucleic acid-binding protein
MVTVIVDTNILFSALISPNGNIARLLTNPSLPIRRVTCHYTMVELFKHQAKIIKNSKKSFDQIVDDYYTLLSGLELHNEALISKTHWREAERLTRGVDAFDISYVALTLETEGVLWTGDKKLTTHLLTMGFTQVISTSELITRLG